MPRAGCGRGPMPSCKSGACTRTCQIRCDFSEGGGSISSPSALALFSDFAPSGARVAGLAPLVTGAGWALVPSERELDGSEPRAGAEVGGCAPERLGSDAASVEWISNPSSTAAAPARSAHELDSMLRVPTRSRTRTTRSSRNRVSIRVIVPSARRWLSCRPDPRSFSSRSRTSLSCGQPGGASQRMSIDGCG